jgi:hypothetical protein
MKLIKGIEYGLCLAEDFSLASGGNGMEGRKTHHALDKVQQILEMAHYAFTLARSGGHMLEGFDIGRLDSVQFVVQGTVNPDEFYVFKPNCEILNDLLSSTIPFLIFDSQQQA